MEIPVDMKILVTGGAGYLGSTLVPLLLNAGHSVRVLDNLNHGGAPLLAAWSDPAFDFRRGDIRDRSAIASALSEWRLSFISLRSSATPRALVICFGAVGKPRGIFVAHRRKSARWSPKVHFCLYVQQLRQDEGSGSLRG